MKTILMGCYGIGVSRIIAAAAEVSHDAKGIIWPPSLAPFTVHLLLLDPNVPELSAVADKLYEDLQSSGFEVLYDDRDERPGVKFADADLIGIPYHIVVGRRTRETGQVEIQTRQDKSKVCVEVAQTAEALQTLSGRSGTPEHAGSLHR